MKHNSNSMTVITYWKTNLKGMCSMSLKYKYNYTTNVYKTQNNCNENEKNRIEKQYEVCNLMQNRTLKNTLTCTENYYKNKLQYPT